MEIRAGVRHNSPVVGVRDTSAKKAEQEPPARWAIGPSGSTRAGESPEESAIVTAPVACERVTSDRKDAGSNPASAATQISSGAERPAYTCSGLFPGA